ncbi:SusC/RagA family TonB-linked outer membrane protein [Flavobacterium rivuli]|uniref:SusC/RagA family TonB-linked outer membrane protein n=1 Tax=Flavobacterium rivuli TaxID=498301 RepID=UPI0018CE501D|nr:TonB-dependent receptor [Flavobacterium rivuli]
MMNQLLKGNVAKAKDSALQPYPNLWLVCIITLLSFPVFAQQQVTGKVVAADNANETLIGASVLSKATKNVANTDDRGSYSIAATATDTLVFTYLGFATKEVYVNGKSVIDVSLTPDKQVLDEVVVVGYGTQKKINLTGSVSAIASKDLENRPITQASQALSGLTSGIVVSQTSGRPGNDGASITIRGQGSYGAGGSPLVILDGIAVSLNDVDPNNIKSISVLKDAASAAIYGSRAANGVIIIETKRGQAGTMQVNYNSYAGFQSAVALPDFLDSAGYAAMRNEANANMGQAASYTDADIEKFRNQSDPDNYPNVPHLKNLLNSGSGFQTNHNLTFMGGNEKTRYLFSTTYLEQNGLVAKNDYKKYNFMLNVDSKIKENLTLKVNLMGYTSETNEPIQSEGDMMSIIGYAVREGPIYAGRKSDGTYGYQDNYSPEAWVDSNSFKKGTNKNFLGSGELAWQPIEGLTLSGKAGYNLFSFYDKNYLAEVQFDQYKTIGPNNLNVYSGQGTQVTLQALATYTKTIKDHSFTLLGGASQEKYSDWSLNGYRRNFPNNLLSELNAASAEGMTTSGSASEWAIRSYFGRLNYSFGNKYLFEANIRTDGTSRFPSEGRWGVFPSFSGGWIVSEESFLKDKLSWLQTFKLRASWGKLGNQNVGSYPYQNRVSLGQNYSFGGALLPGAAVTTTSNSDITWESTATTDFGLDANFFDGKLGLVADFFNKKTSGVLYGVTTSSVLGMGTSPVNVGGVKNTGFEVALNYSQQIGNLKIGISPNFSYIKNEVTELSSGLSEDINSNLFVGQPIGVIYGYVADGLFVNQDDVSAYPSQPYAAEPGLVRYKDISGPDGVPDGKVDATYDRKVIGNTMPKYTYGLNLTANYRGFDFATLLQGLGGYDKQLSSYQAYAFYNGGQIQQWQADNRWTEANPDRNASYPKLTSLNGGSGTTMTSTYWLRNASFLRVKNIQIGYTLPDSLVKDKLKMSRLRFYIGGQNVLSFNHFYKGWDPEMGGGNFYPITKTYTLGLNASF